MICIEVVHSTRTQVLFNKHWVKRIVIKRLLFLLLALGFVSVVFAYLIFPKYCESIAYGVGVVVVSNTYFIIRAFRYSGDISSVRIAASFVPGVMGKLAIAAGLFALLFVGQFTGELFQQSDQVLALMLGFSLVHLTYIVLLALLNSKLK